MQAMGDLGSRPAGGSSPSVLRNQPSGRQCDQQRSAGEYRALASGEIAGTQ